MIARYLLDYGKHRGWNSVQPQGKLQSKNITKEGKAKIKNLHADSKRLQISGLLNAADGTSFKYLTSILRYP